jgi:hypothetical protein
VRTFAAFTKEMMHASTETAMNLARTWWGNLAMFTDFQEIIIRDVRHDSPCIFLIASAEANCI